MDTVKIFISQPMNGRSQDEIIDERLKAFNDACYRLPHDMSNMAYVLVDSFVSDFDESITKNAPLAYLGKCIELMAQADVVYFCEGWQNARGCRIEHECAVQYGCMIME